MSVKRADFKAEEVIAELRQTNQRLAQQLKKARLRNDELIEATYRAAKDAASMLEIPPVRPPKSDPRKKHAETAICVLSDLQLGKRTKSYDSLVCAKRIELYAEKVAKLIEIQRADHPVRNVRVYLLGDVVEGELIFPAQSHLIDASLFQQVLVDGPRIVAGFVRRMLSVAERVDVVAVNGNHGSLGGLFRKQYHPESNADSMLYEATRLILKGEDSDKEPRLTWAPNSVRNERRWYAVDYIGRHGFFLWHGDQAQGGFAGYPWYAVGRRLMAWRNNGIPERFSFSVAGHFHTPVRLYLNGLTHWGNGAVESDNMYASERLAASGEPSQWLLFCHPERGVTAEYLVQLKEAR